MRFKVGDRVRALRSDAWHKKGELGTIDGWPRTVPELIGVCWDKCGEVYPEFPARLELIKGGKPMVASFDQLVKEVGKIDKDGARYLRGDAQKLSSFNREGWLGSVMIWSGTPQGYQYWADLNDKLNLAERGKPMKENKKVYPKKVYILWGCDTNDDRSLTAHEKIEDTSGYRHERVIAIYELKKLVKVEMRPHVRDVKE